MSPDARTPARRAVLRLLIGGVLFALLCAVLGRGLLVEALTVHMLGSNLGLRATVAGAGGSILAGVELRGLRAQRVAGTGPVVSLAADRIEARYSLPALLRGREAFLDSLVVTVEGAVLALDPTGPATPAPVPARPATLPRLPRLSIRDSAVQVVGGSYPLEISGLDVTVDRPNAAGEQALIVQAVRFSPHHPLLRERTPTVTLTGGFASRHLTVAAVHVNGKPFVGGARLALGEGAGEFELESEVRLWGGEVAIAVSRREEGTRVRWEARDVDVQPQEMLVRPALAALRGKISSKGAVHFDAKGLPGLAGELTLQWQGARLAGRDLDRLQIQASIASGLLRVEQAAVRVGPNELELRQVALPARPLFEGRWRPLLQEASGSFAASLGDVPGFLAFSGVQMSKDAAAVPKHSLHLEGSLAGGSVRMTRGGLATGLGSATLSPTTVTLPRGEQGWGETAFVGGAVVSLPDLGELSAIFPLPPLRGSVRGEIAAAGTVARPEGSLSLAGRGIGIAGRTLGDVDVRARGAAGSVEIDTLRIGQGSNSVSAQGVRFSPETLAPFDRHRFLESLAGTFTVACGDIPALADLAGIPHEEAGRAPAGLRLSAAGTVAGRSVAFSSAALAAGEQSVTARGARLVLPGVGAGWREISLEGLFEIDMPDLAAFAALLPVSHPRGALRGQVRIAGKVGEPEGSATITGRGIAFGGHEIGKVVLRARLQGRRASVEECEVVRGRDTLRARGTFDLEKRTLLDGEATFSLEDVAPWLAEFVREGIPVSGRLHGSVRTISSPPGGRVSVAAEFAEGRLWGAPEARVAAEAELSLSDGGSVAIDLRSLEIAAAGTRFSLAGPASLNRDREGRIAIRGLLLSGADGSVAVEGSLAAAGPNDLRVRIERLRGGAWLAALAGDRIAFSGAEGSVRLRGLPREPRIDVTARVAELRGGPDGGSLAAMLDATYEPGRLHIGRLELTGAGGLELSLAGQLPLDASGADLLAPGRITLEGLIRVPDLETAALLLPGQHAVSGGLGATLSASGSWDDPEARLEFHGERLQPPPGSRFTPPGPVAFSGALIWRKSAVQAEKVLLSSPAFTCSLAGSLSGLPDIRALLAGGSDALQGTLALQGSLASPDVAWLSRSVPGLRRVGGSVEGSIGVAGPVRDPAFTGSLRIENGGFRYRDLPLIDGLTFAASAEGRVVTLTDVHGNVGGSPFTIAGSVDLTRGDDPVLDLRLEGRDVLLYRDAGLRVRADSALSLTGPVSALTFAGDVTLANSLYQKDFSVTSLFTGGGKSSKRSTSSLGTLSFPEPPLRDMRFDLRLAARDPFQIRTNIVRGSARPDLSLTGTGALPVLRGPIIFDSTQVLLPSGTLLLERGTVLFRESDPDRPLLDFGGRMQIRGYEITAQLGGTLDAPEVVLSSVPSLPNDELLLLVLTGAMPESAGEQGSSLSAVASPAAVYLGRNVLGQLFGDWAVAEKIGFQDRLDLEVGREVTHSGGLTVSSRFRLREGFLDRDSVLYLTSEKDVYDQYNVGLKVIFRFP